MTYRVSIEYWMRSHVYVDADSREEAESKGMKLYEDDEVDYSEEGINVVNVDEVPWHSV